ncbi:unnamed protein product [Amaranthus hypochondriacus]
MKVILTEGKSLSLAMFSVSSLFSVYASLITLITLIQQLYHQIIPTQIREYITLKIQQCFTQSLTSSPTKFTLVVEQLDESDNYHCLNQVFYACEAYVSTKLKSCSTRLKVTRKTTKGNLLYKLSQGEKYYEVYEGVQLEWNFIYNGKSSQNEIDHSKPFKTQFSNKRYFELIFDQKHKNKIFDSYLPYILKFYDEIIEKKKELNLYTLDCVGGKHQRGWKSVKFKHPFTFDALAMDPEVKKSIINDLNKFIKRKEFYKKIGRAWKRGYLLYGPPGTGKSSLIAAMANYLKFDIYDLQLSSVDNDSALRRLLLSTTNKSILAIEDIDCSLGSTDRQVISSNLANQLKVKDMLGNHHELQMDSDSKMSLSGLLNFIDGLWSSCGDERIFIFTTNHKEKLDPALLRPGRMDMHIHMSYLTMPSFKILAFNYLNILDDHHLFKEIEQLLQSVQVTPAQVAEELIRSDDPEIALSSVVQMLKKHDLGLQQSKIINFPKWNYKNVENGLQNFTNDIDDLSR